MEPHIVLRDKSGAEHYKCRSDVLGTKHFLLSKKYMCYLITTFSARRIELGIKSIVLSPYPKHPKHDLDS